MLAEIGSNVAADIIGGVLIAVLGGGIVWLRRQLKDVGQMTQDWKGIPGRPGVSDEIPGVMKRLYTQDQQFREVMDHLVRQDDTLNLIKHEIEYNSGTSIKDAVHRTDTAVAGMRQDLRNLQASVNTKSSQVSVDNL